MIINVNFQMFCDRFRDMGRNDQFSYGAKEALFNYLEEIEEGMDQPIELDVIAICVDFAEYDSALEAAREYGYEEVVDLEPHGSVDLLEVAELEEAQALEWLEDRTTVLEFDGGVVVQSF